MAPHPLKKSQPRPATIGSKNPYNSRYLGKNRFIGSVFPLNNQASDFGQETII